ncbi:MAG: SpoIVB peptidase [Acetatifactor sp.]
MLNNGKNNEKIKKRAGENAVVILQNWKSRVRRRKIFRACFISALTIAVFAMSGLFYYHVDSNIPSIINIRAGQEQSFFLGVPAKAEIISVSDQGGSNIPKGAVQIDLSRTVTMKMEAETGCRMQVKLFGILPIKQVGIRAIDDEELVPVGMPIGIYVETDGILVIGAGEFQGVGGITYSPGKNIVKSGDYIRKINGEEINKKEELITAVEKSGGKAVILTLERDGEIMDVSIKPQRDKSGKYKIGVWVRDNAQGVGTMTYIDSGGEFGALGHGINDVDTSTLMHMNGGTLYETSIIDIKKGTRGNPGEMTGMIVYSDDRILGNITENSSRGIFGNCNTRALAMEMQDPVPIGLKQEIKLGPAQILCTIEEEPAYYDVEITDIHLSHDNINRGIELKVTDKKLLELTGGIVQGMSGSPILQNGKFIGAVTHVLVQDSTRGYGIFIENMLEH